MGSPARSAAKGANDEEVQLYRRLAQYFSAAMDIRNGLEFNRLDAEFVSSEHGVVQYVFDSNVLLFFLNPTREAEAVDPFASRDGQLNPTLALVTAEYLFSGGLTGQFSARPLISQWHWEEVSSAVSKLRKRMGALAADSTAVARGADDEQLGEKVALLVRHAQTERSLGASNDHLAAMEPRIRALVDDATYAITMFDRLKSSNPVEPLTLDENAVGGVLNLDEARVAEWRERIALNRDKTEGYGAPHTRNDARDARTVEQVIQLNLNAQNAGGVPKRYVMLSHDRSLFNAGVSWWQNKPELDFFPFRRLSQYIPILNTEAMPNATQDTGLSDQLQDVLDTLLQIGPRTRRRLPLYVPTPNIAPPEKSLASELSPVIKWIIRNTQHVRSNEAALALWREISATSILLNAELLRRRIRAFAPLADFIESSRDVRAGVVDFMHQRIEAYEAAHLELNLLHYLANQIILGQTLARDSRAMRGILVLHEDFEAVVGQPGQLYAFLEDIVREADADKIRALAGRLSALKPHTCHFLAGCITFWAGDWDSAAHHAKRAIATSRTILEEAVGGDAIIDAGLLDADLTYFRVVAARYAALDIEDDLRLIEGRLVGLAETVDEMKHAAHKAATPFARVRATVEEALRHTSLAFVISSSSIERSADVVNAANTAYAIFDAIEGEARKVWAKQPTEIRTLMQVEFFTGVVGCLLIRSMGDQARAAQELERWSHLRDQLTRAFAKNKSLVPSFYEVSINFLDLILCEDLAQASERRSVLEIQLHKVLEADEHMTWFDRYVLDDLLKRLDHIGPQPLNPDH